MQLGIRAKTVMALSLVPLVCVAWADGRLDKAERTAILEAAIQNRCPAGSAGFQLLDHWLERAPDASLFNAWRDYVRALAATLPADARQTLQHDVISHARSVASAAGGILGVGRISKQEERVLAEASVAFDTTQPERDDRQRVP
jgi:hypothetical protein